MSEETTVEKSQVVLRHLATVPPAYHLIPKAEALQETPLQGEPLSSDVRTFCALIAYIMMRCLKERNPRVMELLSFPSKAEEAKEGGNCDAA